MLFGALLVIARSFMFLKVSSSALGLVWSEYV